jgi:hypothetical protein
VTITGAVYPEVAELLELVDPAKVAERKDREARRMYQTGRLYRSPGRDEWIFYSRGGGGKELELVVDCRDLAFSSGRRSPNEHILRSVWEAVQRSVGDTIDAEVAAALRGETA